MKPQKTSSLVVFLSLKMKYFWTSLVVQWIRICCKCRGPTCDRWSGKIPHTGGQLSPRTTTTEPARQSPPATVIEAHVPTACSLQEKPLQGEAHEPQQRVTPTFCNQEKPACGNKDPTQPKQLKKKRKYFLPKTWGS